MQRDIESRYPDIKLHLSGMIMLNNAFSEASKGDILFLVPLSFLVMLIILGITIGGITGTFHESVGTHSEPSLPHSEGVL